MPEADAVNAAREWIRKAEGAKEAIASVRALRAWVRERLPPAALDKP